MSVDEGDGDGKPIENPCPNCGAGLGRCVKGINESDAFYFWNCSNCGKKYEINGLLSKPGKKLNLCPTCGKDYCICNSLRDIPPGCCGSQLFPEKPVKKLKGQSIDFLAVDDYCKKVWTVGEVSILAGLTILAGFGLWKIVEIICGL